MYVILLFCSWSSNHTSLSVFQVCRASLWPQNLCTLSPLFKVDPFPNSQIQKRILTHPSDGGLVVAYFREGCLYLIIPLSFFFFNIWVSLFLFLFYLLF